MTTGLVYVGKIINLEPIDGADFIVSATVVCGDGGKWRGIVKKDDFDVGNLCIVYLPDSIVPPTEQMKFMESSHFRVKMRRFKSAPSEVLIMPYDGLGESSLGDDLTEQFGVRKYIKPMPAHLNGEFKGDFPSFIPKTDEPNYQRSPELVDMLVGKSYYITEKADGSSTTAYRFKGEFGLCSRNLELVRNPENGYWKVALKYNLEENLPEGIALQWETVGPGIQSNPMGFEQIDGLAFSAYNILEHRYLNLNEFCDLCHELKFPRCAFLKEGDSFNTDRLELLGEGRYKNGKQREGVVVRSQENLLGHAPISFKVINLEYER